MTSRARFAVLALALATLVAAPIAKGGTEKETTAPQPTANCTLCKTNYDVCKKTNATDCDAKFQKCQQANCSQPLR